ncbi:GHMP family kinase ATP-binding protein [Bacillus massiliigorillae]|uniref:GHMP family kinase ATP-binding protein n=1 Tax=Bacillus massiliigorillae TaxID=1243664 RepID=UPI0005A6B4FF|nr:propanediol utilization protein [Bacillus massiliigorillae]
MKVTAKCPASCGELIQGWIEGSVKLISYPINWYSEVTLEEQLEHKYLVNNLRHSKAWRAFYATCKHYDVSIESLPPITLTIASTIPIAKGMASSTADVAATVVATARLLGCTMTPQKLATICLSMEPTDSTIFPNLTLFDHIHGKVMVESSWSPRFGVLVLEPLDILITEEFHSRNVQEMYKNQALELEEAYSLYKQAINEESLLKLGEAATISATVNQAILPKPKFNELLEVVDTTDLLGINVAHSGTVIGLMYDEAKMNRQDLLYRLEEKRIFDAYPRYHFHHSVYGGVTLQLS